MRCRPKCPVTITICYYPDDEKTRWILDWFSFHTNLRLKRLALSLPELGRRSIGRNRAALATDANIVWFADVDHAWGYGCLDRLSEMEWPESATLCYPKQVMIHKDHATGDRATSVVLEKDLQFAEIKTEDFVPKSYRKAIGGVQIVQGDLARDYGYLDGIARWQTPRDDGLPFGDFRDDLAFRGVCRMYGKQVGIDLPGVYRIRHVRTTYQ